MVETRGRNIKILGPILSLPQGSWLKMGIKGGRLKKRTKTYKSVKENMHKDAIEVRLIILSVLAGLKNSFIN